MLQVRAFLSKKKKRVKSKIWCQIHVSQLLCWLTWAEQMTCGFSDFSRGKNNNNNNQNFKLFL